MTYRGYISIFANQIASVIQSPVSGKFVTNGKLGLWRHHLFIMRMLWWTASIAWSLCCISCSKHHSLSWRFTDVTSEVLPETGVHLYVECCHCSCPIVAKNAVSQKGCQSEFYEKSAWRFWRLFLSTDRRRYFICSATWMRMQVQTSNWTNRLCQIFLSLK